MKSLNASRYADGRFIVTGSNDETAKIWDSAKKECVSTWKGHTGPINSVAVSFVR